MASIPGLPQQARETTPLNSHLIEPDQTIRSRQFAKGLSAAAIISGFAVLTIGAVYLDQCQNSESECADETQRKARRYLISGSATFLLGVGMIIFSACFCPEPVDPSSEAYRYAGTDDDSYNGSG